MTIRKNPALEAYEAARKSGKYSEEELQKLLDDLDINKENMPTVQEMREVKGTKPVTTLGTLEDEEFALDAPLGGPMATTKQRETNKAFEEHISEKSEKKG